MSEELTTEERDQTRRWARRENARQFADALMRGEPLPKRRLRDDDPAFLTMLQLEREALLGDG